MWRNYLKTGLRNLWKNRIHAFVNLSGLSLGVAGCIVLFLYVQYHTSFEEHIPEADRIHRFAMEFEFQGELAANAITLYPTVGMIRDGVSQVEAITFLDWVQNGQIGIDRGERIDRLVQEGGVYYVDSMFFEMFPQSFLVGEANRLAEQASGAVITRQLAETWFGSPAEALGKPFLFNDADEFTVVGVIENPPTKTDFDFQVLLPTQHRQDFYDSRGWNYFSTNFQCFYRMQAGEDANLVPEFLQAYLVENSEGWDEDFFFRQQPLVSMHNDEKYGGFTEPVIPWSRLYGLIAIALILVLTACINFVNLATALAIHRAKEVGIRKSLGSARRQLIFQFLGETTVVVGLALVLALVLAELALVQLDGLLGQPIRILSTAPWQLGVFLMGIGIVVVLISGLYPAYVMSAFQPVKALKESPTRMNTGRISLRKTLVVLQFGISQAMIIATVIVMMQTRHAAKMDLGMNPTSKLIVGLETDDVDRQRSFQDAIRQISGVETVSLSSGAAASDNISINSFTVDGEGVDIEYLSVDEHFMEAYGITLLAGEGLLAADSATRCVVNEALVRHMGWGTPEEAIGRVLSWRGGQDIMVTGVIKDYHIHSIREKINPLVLVNDPERMYGINVAIAPGYTSEVLAKVQEVWAAFFPEYVMSYEFQDDLLAEFYEADRRLSTLFQIFSVLAIFIGCLGLYGLSSFLISRKAKEIGVRKVLGASVQQILWIFSREYVLLIIAGFLLAAPVTYYLMGEWLADFQYRISLSWWLFAVGVVSALLVALVTVGYRSYRAARTNPVNALKYE